MKYEREQQDRDFRKAVWQRDGYECRWCGCPVQRSLGRTAERGEVHHIHGRLGILRWEVKAALLLCCECHEKVTGRVNERWRIVGDKTFTAADGHKYTDATHGVTFERIA